MIYILTMHMVLLKNIFIRLLFSERNMTLTLCKPLAYVKRTYIRLINQRNVVWPKETTKQVHLTPEWSFLQLLIIIIYNSTWWMLIQWTRFMIVRWQSVNTKKCILPVCKKPYHTNKSSVQNAEEIEVLRN